MSYFLLLVPIALIIIISLSIYYYDQWTISVQATKDDDDKQRALKMNAFGDSGGSDTGFYIIAVLGFILVFVLFALAIYYGTKAQTQRYNLAADAVKKGNTKLAAVALAPEIGEGVREAEEGLGDMIWGRGRGYGGNRGYGRDRGFGGNGGFGGTGGFGGNGFGFDYNNNW